MGQVAGDLTLNVKHLLVPPVHELLNARGSALEVIDDKPAEVLLVQSAECKMKLHQKISRSVPPGHTRENTLEQHICSR